jgi:hypothetical protein
VFHPPLLWPHPDPSSRAPLAPPPAAGPAGPADAPAAAGTARRPHKVWPVDAARFSTHRVCAIRHDFQDHPLMQLPALAELAKGLIHTKQCRFITPGATQASTFDHGDRPADGRDIDEVFRRIEEPGSWIALYNVETDPKYNGFLQEVADCVRPLVEREQPDMFKVCGFIFVSAPPSVTPFHIDRENNFWLQMKGRKTMNVWDPGDRTVVSGKDVDEFIVYASLDNVRLKDGYVERSHAFDVGVGDGVYFPSTAPHMTKTVPGWEKPGDGVSVSIGIVFYTDYTRRHAYVHAWNLFLRQFGLSPSHPGERAWVDAIKHPLGRALVWAKKTFRGYEPRVGF